MKDKKLGFLVFAMIAVFGLTLAVPMDAYAGTFYGPAFFKTEDGKYELTIKTTSSQNDVDVAVEDIWKVSWSTGQKYATHTGALSVRLCSASTGNCTSFKPFYEGDGVGHNTFTNMIPGTYYVDIRDSESGYYYQGDVWAHVY